MQTPLLVHPVGNPSNGVSGASLLSPAPARVGGLEIDQVLNCSLAARVLDRMLANVIAERHTVHVLEVSAQDASVLRRFLDARRVQLHGCNLEKLAGDPCLPPGPFTPFPFPTESFAAVVSLDILERVSAEDRRAFISECLRVARHGCVFAAPDSPALAEELLTLLRGFEYPHAILETAAEQVGVGPRKLYVCAKNFDATAALEAPAEPFPEPPVSADPPDVLVLLHRRLAVLEAECSARRLEQTVTASLLQSLERSWSVRLTAPLRLLRRLVKPRGFDARALLTWQQLERLPGTRTGAWQAKGDQPQFLVPCELPAGWVRVRLKMDSSEATRFALHADSGEGFASAPCLKRLKVDGPLETEFHVRLARPARAIRIDPVGAPIQFRLERLEIEPVPLPHICLRALAAKLRLLGQHGLVLRTVFRGLAVLARGRVRIFRRKWFSALNAPTQGK